MGCMINDFVVLLCVYQRQKTVQSSVQCVRDSSQSSHLEILKQFLFRASAISFQLRLHAAGSLLILRLEGGLHDALDCGQRHDVCHCVCQHLQLLRVLQGLVDACSHRLHDRCHDFRVEVSRTPVATLSLIHDHVSCTRTCACTCIMSTL